MKSRKELLIGLLTFTVSLAVVNAAPMAAHATTGPVFTVMNTSETPPDGVWFRRSPHVADTDSVTGHGVYMGEQVQLRCFSWGDAVGAFGNTLWYNVLNISRPSNAGVENSGYLSAHYINDGLAANQVDSGVPDCSAAPSPAPTQAPTPGGGASPPPNSVTCYGDYCSGRDPQTTGCAADATTVAWRDVPGARLELRWSQTCKTNWARYIQYPQGFGGSTALQLRAVQKGTAYTQRLNYDINGTPTGTTWSPMIYSPVKLVRAEMVYQCGGVGDCLQGALIGANPVVTAWK